MGTAPCPSSWSIHQEEPTWLLKYLNDPEAQSGVRTSAAMEQAVSQETLGLSCLCGLKTRRRRITCPCCRQAYHQYCLGLRKDLAEYWERTGWRCIRCLARWHVEDALQKIMAILSAYRPPFGWSGLSAFRAGAHSPESQATGLFRSEGSPMHFHGASPAAPAAAPRDEKVTAWMRVLLDGLKRCSHKGVREIQALANPEQAKHSILVQVVHLAHADPDVLSDPAVGDAVHYLAIIVWGARLLCQLRRRPALPDLQALRQEMASLNVVNRPLTVMLTDLIERTLQWADHARPALREVWMQPPDVPVDMDRLMPLVQRGRGPPVRTCLERRLRAMLRDRGKRFCRCRGFNDGGLMLRCHACKEWFHGKCVQIRKEALPDDAEYTCESCCRTKGRCYPWPPYQPLDIEAELLETAELSDDEEADDTKDDDINRCLEGIWPSMHHLAQLGLCEAPLKLPPASPLPPMTLPPSLDHAFAGRASYPIPSSPAVFSLSTSSPLLHSFEPSHRILPCLSSPALTHWPQTAPMPTPPYGQSWNRGLAETRGSPHGMAMPMLSLVPPPFPTPQPWAGLQHPPALSCPALMLNNCYGPARELPPWRTFYHDSVLSRPVLGKRSRLCFHPDGPM